MIRVACKKCGTKLKVKDELEGKTGKCPSCGAPVKIQRTASAGEPAAASAPAPTPPPAPAKAKTKAAAPDPNDPSAPIPFDSLEDDDDAPTPIILSGGEVPPAATETEVAPATQQNLQVSTDQAIDLHDPDEDFHVPTHLDLNSHYLICDHKDVVGRWQNDGKGWMIRLKDGFTRAATVSGEIPQFGSFVLVEIGVEHKEDGMHLRNITPFKLKPQYALLKLTKGDDAILTVVIGPGEMNERQKRHVRDLVKSKFLPKTWDALKLLLP